jgi:DNA-binding transcriptional regulator YhcF (GntR family)
MTAMIDMFEKDIEQLKTQLATEDFPQEQRFQMLQLISRTRELVQEETARQAEKLNTDFVQLYRKNIESIVELGKRSQMAVLIFVYILKSIDRQNSIVISQDTLGEIFEVSRTTIWKAQKELEKSKFIQVVKIGNANAYVVNSELVWTTHNNKKEYAYFTAQVIASKSEQKLKKLKTTKIPVAHLERSLFKDELEALPPPVV